MPIVSVISAFYNEEALAPLFLKHYDYADKIHVLFDTATDDKTLDILTQDTRVTVHPVKYPDDGLDWEIKQARVNDLALRTKSDWIIAVDADEFIWPFGNEHRVKEWLDEQKGTVIKAAMFTVYRNIDDADIDPTIPPMYQRRYGSNLIGTSYGIPLYVKPCIARGDIGMQWDCGCHSEIPNPKITMNWEKMTGAHWCMADPELAVSRRLAQKKRQGKNNLAKGLGVQNHNITEQEIRDECKAHQFDPQLF